MKNGDILAHTYVYRDNEILYTVTTTNRYREPNERYYETVVCNDVSSDELIDSEIGDKETLEIHMRVVNDVFENGIGVFIDE